MRTHSVLAGILASTLFPGFVDASSHHGGGGGGGFHSGHHGGGFQGPGAYHGGFSYPIGLGVGGGGWGWYGFPYYGTVGPVGPMYFAPAMTQFAPVIVPMVVDRGAVGGPMPPARFVGQGGVPVRQVKRADPAKSTQLVTVGDRLFRAGNFKRAAERFEQAARTDPDAAAPRARLAQVALVRGQFKESAQYIRDAIAADPRWLANAPDIQTMYAEPADFHRQISRLESRVLVEPSDRDAWLVLGAELYLSGQTRRASDIFLRLSDRKPDPTLAAFLDASNAPADDTK